jgi:hypothetical protein
LAVCDTGNLSRSYERGSPVSMLSAAARVADDLAACFGGTLFGKAAFNPSVAVVRSKPECGKLGGNTRNRMNALNAVSFVVAVATYLPGRLGSTAKDRGRRTPGSSSPRTRCSAWRPRPASRHW